MQTSFRTLTEGRAKMETDVPAQERFGSTLFWRVFAVINLVVVAWVVWLIWQLTPRAVVNEFVLHLPPPASQSRSAASGIAIQSGAPMKPLRLETEIKALPKRDQPVATGK